MTTTLYDQLKDTEHLDDTVLDDIEGFRSSLENYAGLPGADPRIPEASKLLSNLGPNPLVDVKEVQRKVFLGYAGNPIVRDAVKGVQSVEDAVREIAEINRGYKRFLPRRKDKVHNERLENLGSVLPFDDGAFKTRGIHHPDNLVAGTVLGAGMAFAVPYTIALLLMDAQHNEEAVTSFLKAPLYLTPIFCSLMGFTQQLWRSGKAPVEKAKYIDEKIRELGDGYDLSKTLMDKAVDDTVGRQCPFLR